MRTSVKSSISAQGAVSARPFDRLTKAQMVELLNHNISKPLTPEQFQRCAASALYRWCASVIAGQFASMIELTDRLGVLEKIYRNR